MLWEERNDPFRDGPLTSRVFHQCFHGIFCLLQPELPVFTVICDGRGRMFHNNVISNLFHGRICDPTPINAMELDSQAMPRHVVIIRDTAVSPGSPTFSDNMEVSLCRNASPGFTAICCLCASPIKAKEIPPQGSRGGSVMKWAHCMHNAPDQAWAHCPLPQQDFQYQ